MHTSGITCHVVGVGTLAIQYALPRETCDGWWMTSVVTGTQAFLRWYDQRLNDCFLVDSEK